MADLEPGRAARDYALAVCPQNDESCARQVAQRFEQRLEEAFGVLEAAGNPAPVTQRLRGPGGQDIGSITLQGGDVRLCLHGAAGDRCATVGHGIEAALAAEALLRVMGIEVVSP